MVSLSTQILEGEIFTIEPVSNKHFEPQFPCGRWAEMFKNIPVLEKNIHADRNLAKLCERNSILVRMLHKILLQVLCKITSLF